MKYFKKKIMAVLLAAMLILFTASCGESVKSNVSGSDMNTGFDPGTTLARGVWTADDGENRLGYFLLKDEENGEYVDSITGTKQTFNVTLDKKIAVFTFDSLDEPRTAEVIISDNGVRRLLWLNEEQSGKYEYWSLIVGADPESFSFYSAEALTAKAQKAFEEEHGFPPEYVSYYVDVSGNVLITLETDVESFVASSYEIFSVTGKGKNVSTGEAVDFS